MRRTITESIHPAVRTVGDASAPLGALDLNLLRVFDAVVAEGRVSRASDRLGLTQPAVSNALKRLRLQLGDALFVPTPQGMVPTPRAEQLAPAIAQALATLQAALQPPAMFAPQQTQRRFTLAMTDIGEIVFLPPLLAHLQRHAPGVQLSTVRSSATGAEAEAEADTGTGDLAAQLATGAVDLAVGLLPQLKAGFFQRRLFSQRYVCLLRKAHPLAAAGALSEDAYRAAQHVVVVAAGTGHGQVDAQLARRGIRRRVALTVPHFVAVGQIVAASDLVATVPERLAQSLAGPFKLAVVPHPVALPEVAIRLFWHASVQADAGNRWLRGVMGELFSG